ncbi:MAG: MFS transporter [Flavobacteriales bacterium]|nr:MFS transporter [Flavobacteriales bacterium]MCC6939949.1 MFS transporter [Flavobacteriales bacterium]
MDRRLLILWFTIFIDLIGFTLFIPVVPYFAGAIGASDAVVMLSAALFSIMVFMCSPIWGSVSDRYGRRPVIMVSILISLLSYVVFAHATTIFLLFLSRFLTGIGSGNIAAAQAYISDITPPKDRAKRIGLIVGASFGMSFAVGPAIGGYIFHHFGGIGSVGYFAVGLCLLNLLGVAFVLPESNTSPDTTRAINFKPFSSTFKSLRDLRFRDLFLIGFVYITAFSMMNVSITFLWMQRYHLTVDQTGLMFSAVGLLSAFSQGALVHVFNRLWGERRMLVRGCVMVGLGLAAMPFVPVGDRANVAYDAAGRMIPLDLSLAFVLMSLVPMILLSMGNACLNPSLVSILSRKADAKEQGAVMGQNQGFGSLGRVVGPVMAGPLYVMGQSLPFVVGGTIMLGTLWLIFNYLRTNYTPLEVAPSSAD